VDDKAGAKDPGTGVDVPGFVDTTSALESAHFRTSLAFSDLETYKIISLTN
jgi:hypothetical protein